MMRRKLVKQGNNALTLTLPAQWIKEHNLNAGDEVEVVNKLGQLTIYNQETKPPEEKEEYIVKIDSAKDFLKRSFGIGYLKGYNQIRIESPDPKVFDLVKGGLDMFMGLEMIDQGKNYCILKNIAKEVEEDFETIFNRIFYLTSMNFTDLISALQRGNNGEFERILNSDSLLDKLNYFCRKTLINYVPREKNKRYSYYTYITRYEETSDHLRNIVKYLQENKIKEKERVIYFIENLLDLLKELHSIFQRKFDLKSMKKFSDRRRALKEEFKGELSKAGKTERYILLELYPICSILHHLSEEVI